MIIGYQKEWQFLKKSFLNSKLTHGYLFSGPEAVGKKTLAIEFAKFLHCQEKEIKKRPCEVCPACQMVLKGIHPDALFLAPLVKNKEIQIAQIRDLISKLSLKPFFSAYKTVIVDQAHLMNSQAQNCFLKTLEEPKGNTLLILITEHPEALAGTIRSRLQEIKFFPLARTEIIEFLERQGIKGKKAEEIAVLSLGRMGRVLNFLANPDRLAEEKGRMLSFLEVLDSDMAVRFQYVESIAKEPLGEILEIWLRYFREIFLSKVRNSTSAAIVGTNQYSLVKVKKICEELERINFLISTSNLNQRLALEILMMNI